MEEGLRSTRASRARDGADPGRTGYDGSAMIKDTCHQNGDRHDHRVVLLGQQAEAFRRTARRCATAPPDTRPAARPPRSRMPSAVALSTIMIAGPGRAAPLSYWCLAPLPERQTARSRPRRSHRIRTRIAHGIVTATRGCSWNPLPTAPSSEVSGFRTEPPVERAIEPVPADIPTRQRRPTTTTSSNSPNGSPRRSTPAPAPEELGELRITPRSSRSLARSIPRRRAPRRCELLMWYNQAST